MIDTLPSEDTLSNLDCLGAGALPPTLPRFPLRVSRFCGCLAISPISSSASVPLTRAPRGSKSNSSSGRRAEGGLSVRGVLAGRLGPTCHSGTCCAACTPEGPGCGWYCGCW